MEMDHLPNYILKRQCWVSLMGAEPAGWSFAEAQVLTEVLNPR